MEYSACVSYSGVLWKESESADPIFRYFCLRLQSIRYEFIGGTEIVFPLGLKCR
jgi:hypothetical protein